MTDQITSISPVTGETLATFEPRDASEVQNTVRKARSAARKWAETSLNTRIRFLRRLRSRIMDRSDEIVDYIVEETGKPRIEALTGEVMVTVEFLKYYESSARDVLTTDYRTTPLSMFGNRSVVEHRPYGVVVIIAPWNYPLQLTLVPALTALVAGNAVVIKPSEYTPMTGALAGELLDEAGGPEHLSTVVQGGPETGQALVEADPDKIFFTGSVRTGQQIRKQAAERMIPVELEMGGKDPMIVLEDAHVERAAKAAAWGAFCNAGQVCISIERAYVHEDVLDEFLSELLDVTNRLEVGSGPDADIGPLIHPDQASTIKQQVDDALSGGASLRTTLEFNNRFVHPIVLTDVDETMSIMQEETFGPVIGLQSFEHESDAVRLANSTRFGLNASVFSQDEQRARRIASQLDTGACYINNVITNVGNPYLPFGGNKQSGLGRYHGPEGLQAFTRPTSIMIDRWHGTDEPNWFPYSEEFYQAIRSFLLLRFGNETFPEKLRRGIHLIKKIIRGKLQ